MKRGVVVKQSRRSTIVLTSDGMFLEISAQQQAEVGQEVEFSAQELVKRTRIRHWTPSMKNFMRVAVLVLVFVLALFPVYSWYTGSKAYAYVSLDFNPSIELKVNNRMDVVSVAALNEDAKTVLADMDKWQGEPVEKVAASILRRSSELGLLTDSESIIIGVNYIGTKQEDKQLTSILEGSVNSFNKTLHIASFQVPDKVRQTAQDEQKSMNEVMAQTIIEEEDASNSNSALTQSDSAIIKDFYKDDVQEQKTDEEDISRQTKESIDSKTANTVEEQSVKKKENTVNKIADIPSEQSQEADQSKEVKKQMKEVAKQTKEAKKQADKEEKAAKKQEKKHSKSEPEQRGKAAEKERPDKHNKHHDNSRKNQRESASDHKQVQQKDKTYRDEKDSKRPAPSGHQDKKNEQQENKEKQRNSQTN